MAENQDEVTLLKQKLAEAEAQVAQAELERNQAREEKGKKEQELLDANKLVDDLNTQLAEKPAPADGHTATLGVAGNAVKYRFVAPKFKFKGKLVKAVDVKSNSELLKELVEAGAGVLVEVPKK